MERAILDIPKFGIPWALSLGAGAGIGNAFPELFNLSGSVAGDTGAKIGKVGGILIGETSIQSITSLVSKFFASKGEGINTADQPKRGTTLGETIALSQSIQRCIDELVSGDALLIIDRELVKMRDAHDKALKVAQELKKMMEQAKSGEVLEDTFVQQLENTLHATTEAVYYAEKVGILVNCLVSSLNVLQNALDMYEAHVDLIFEKLKGHIIEHFTLVEP